MRGFWESVLDLNGEIQGLTAVQMMGRAMIVYIVTIALIRLGKKRFMGSATPFDAIVGIVLGSMVSRAVTGNAPLGPSLGAAATIMAMHWLFSAAAVRSHAFGTLIKGRDRLVIKDGTADPHMLRKLHMTDRDLAEDLRQNGLRDCQTVAKARIERDGRLSVIKAPGEVKIVDIGIAAGVQTVRLEVRAG